MSSTNTIGDLPNSPEYGTEEKCFANNDGPHEPDWGSVHLESDGGELYLDVNCVHCGRGGCIAAVPKLAREINW